MATTNHRIGSLLCVIALTVFGCSAKTDSKHQQTDNDASAESARPPFDPTIARTPTASKSLTFGADWKAPAPTRTKPPRAAAQRVQAPTQFGAPTRSIGPYPTDAQLGTLNFFVEPLRPVAGASSSKEETAALAAALREEAHDDRRIEAVQHFVDTYPQSRWAPVLHLNIGAISYNTGYFQEALTHWKAAWELAKNGEDIVSQDIANLALAEYAKMNARIGRLPELEALITEAQKRNLMGDARVKIESAAEGLWAMNNPASRFDVVLMHS